MLDLILWGATGYTGQLVAEYIAEHHGADATLRFGLGGRNRAKLEALRGRLARFFPTGHELPLFVADSEDSSSLATMVAEAKVICSTVGPYLRYGDALVREVAAAGRGYCDLTGETPFMRQCIDRYDDIAKTTGARIVHACGFDSIPSDLGCLMVQEQALADHGAPCDRVRFVLLRSRGGFSGGTAASMLEVLSRLGDAATRKVLFDPYGLDPDGSPRGPDGRDPQGVSFDRDLGRFIGPFMMAPVNTRVVRRSHALLGHPWGEGFAYGERQAHGSGLGGAVRALTVTGTMSAFNMALMVPPARSLLSRFVLPDPGQGPSREEREAGFFTAAVIGHGRDAAGQPFRVRGEVAGTRDPGYGETAKMLGESALCLARDGAALPQRPGVLTPATAMGATLIGRLRGAGMTFEARSWPSS